MLKEINSGQFPEGINGREKPESAREQWKWAEPTVWTDRMLTALETGVKGGKWYCLMDKVKKPANLYESFKKVKAKRGSAGMDNVTVKMFEGRLEENIRQIINGLSEGTYKPSPVKRKYIPKPGSKRKRPLGIPTVRDRVVQGALKHVLEPIYERDFAEHSYGFRPGRGCKDALRRVDKLLKEGYTWVVDADIEGYFDTIPHERLMEKLRRKISDGAVLNLVEMFLHQEILEELSTWTPRGGIPQGAVLSPLLANIYLNDLDHLMEDSGYEMVRYADDFVVLSRSEKEAEKVLERLKDWTTSEELSLHPEKTHIVDATQRGGFDFLGYHFERGYRWPRKKSIKKLKEAIKEKTKRCNGHSMKAVITSINPILKGWFEYFKHSHAKTTFPRIDQWIRMRLRSILRKRMKLKGRGRGKDHQRWPNSYFAEQGLFFLTTAHAKASQSARR